MSTATDYLRKALDALLAERSNLDQQIEVISRTLGELEPHDLLDIAAPVTVQQPSTRISRPVVDIILELARERTAFTTEELMTILRSEGNTAQRASVSSTLSRLVREGTLAKGPRRGSFQSVQPLRSTFKGDELANDREQLQSERAMEFATGNQSEPMEPPIES